MGGRMYNNILVPVDLDHGDVGGGALLLARHIGGPAAKITLLTVTEAQFAAFAAHLPQQVLDGHDKDVRERLRELAREIDDEAAVVVRHGKPADEILEEAQSLGADATIISSISGAASARMPSCSLLTARISATICSGPPPRAW